MGFFKNFGEAMSEAGGLISDGWKCIKKGNIADGLGNIVGGTASFAGNTLTLGGAHYVGEVIADTDFGESLGETVGKYKEGEEKRNEKAEQGWKDIGEVYKLGTDHFKNGNIMGGVWSYLYGSEMAIGNSITGGYAAGAWGQGLADDIDFDAEGDGVKFKEGVDPNVAQRIMARIAKGDADSEILQQNCEATGHLGYANLMGAVDTASLVVDVVAGANFTHVATAPVKGWVKAMAKEGVKEGTKQVVKAGAAEAAQQVATYGAKKAVKKATKKAVTWGVKTATTGLVTLSTAQVCSAEVNTMVKDTKENGFFKAVTHAAVRQGANMTGDAMELADDIADSTIGKATNVVSGKVDSWLAKFPGLARIVNTCKAAGYATTKTLGSTAVVSTTVAAGKKFIDIGHHYNGVAVGDIAAEVRRDANANDESWTDLYAKRVAELDSDMGIDASDRIFVGSKVEEMGLT